MDTTVLTPQQAFYLPQYLVVPLFQRPYVWQETDQWEPLWLDIARMADVRLRDPHSKARHFLGAIVLQIDDDVAHGSLPTKNVIDGQQRITSLQVLIDAAAAVLSEHGAEGLANQLADLTHNRSYDPTVKPTLKLQHTNRDRAAFSEVMAAEPPVEHAELDHSGSLTVGAHEYFTRVVTEWLGSPNDPQFTLRADTLVQVLVQGLQLVVIDLKADEDSQEIFETLNARGTPLTAADLIKNFVFQKLQAEGVDTAAAYAEDWPFESSFWETDVSVGRTTMTRSSLFLGQWLAAHTGEEISPKQTFSRFKHYVEHEAATPMADLLKQINVQADQYEQWTVAAQDGSRLLTPTERAVYRMSCSGMELLKPVLIWLNDPALGIPPPVVDAVIARMESWVMRRQLLRLSTGPLGTVVADIIRTHRSASAYELEQRVEAHLARQAVESTYWPGDDEIRDYLHTEQVYRRFPRTRLRMYLEAIEDHLRSRHSYPAMPRQHHPIEHVMPQRWQTHWPVDGLEAEITRSEHVHRLGNLTLLTKSLNSSVSNGPWTGPKGKRGAISKHDVFLLNRDLRDAETWDEQAVVERTGLMIDALLQTWPVPEGHVGKIEDQSARNQTWIEIKHLVGAGLLASGTRLLTRSGEAATARITESALIEVDGKIFSTPSAAAVHVRGRSTNGWRYWVLEDGRQLYDVRAQYRGDEDTEQRFDWSSLHRILEQLPEGRWTSYGELADAVGTAAQAVGNHVVACRHCANSWRVLTADGQISESFRWPDAEDDRDPLEVLQTEGLTFLGGKADPARRLAGDELAGFAGAGTDTT